jgi:oligoribonuclease
MDCEMTGLEPAVNHLIEIATIVTDWDLNILAEGPVLAIYQPPEVLDLMDEWNQKTHAASGLLKRVQASTIHVADAEQHTLDFLRKWVSPHTSPLCGNSISQDRRFLKAYMPTLEAFFHYRNLDVSSFKICAQAWAPKVLKHIVKPTDHLALSDVRASIDELKVYRQMLLKPSDEMSS